MAAFGVLVAIIAGACGSDDPRPRPSRDIIYPDVTFGAALGEIRGHHLVCLELLRDGDLTGALAHAGHPIAEILQVVSGKIRAKNADAATALAEALNAVLSAARAKKPATEVTAAIETAEESARKAEAAVVGDLQTSAVYQGSVVAAILSTAALEYGEAVQAGKIAALIEYQDAYGFVRVAKELFTGIREAVTRIGAVEAKQIDDAFGRLEKALPSPAPPATPVRPEDVRKEAVLVGAKIQETVGAVLAPVREPREIVTRIKQLLDQALVQHQRGQKQAAADLASEAYLQNYELIEVDVIQLAEPVNDELEPILGAQLRDRILAGAPADEIRRLVDRAKALLTQALDVLEKG